MKSSETRSREKLVNRVILPAIQGKNCPICLGGLEPRAAAVLEACKHAYCVRCIRKWSNLRRNCPLCNSTFDSWHVMIERQRSRPLPWRRSFGRPGSVAEDVINQRKLQWRVSIYDRGLQAVPSAPRNRVRLSVPVNDGVRERMLQRIEPWIRRELHALIGDPDPSVVVHVIISLFLSSPENKGRVSPRLQQGFNGRDDFLEPMRPFLHDRTDMFWHELRCFAESPFNIETYDGVAEYRKLS